MNKKEKREEGKGGGKGKNDIWGTKIYMNNDDLFIDC